MQTASPYNPYQPPVEPITQEPPTPAPVVEAPPLFGEDPVSKSALITGIVAVLMAEIPVLSILAIILGLRAMSKAQEGRERVESSNGELRGKGAHIAGRILGIGAVIEGTIMSLYWLWAWLAS
jgi:hypothetical protein